MTQEKGFTIFAVSDATGKLADEVAVAASRQFVGINTRILQRSRVGSDIPIEKVITEAKAAHGVILFTAVSQKLRQQILTEAKKAGVVAMDIMGPVLDMLSNYFHELPSDEPGLKYKLTQDYFNRTEAMEFTVRHDDGNHLADLDQADIVILGVSRSSKTPLSVYLAYLGYRCANIPVVLGQNLPSEVLKVDPKKVFGLIVNRERLMHLRSTRMKKMGRSDTEEYASETYVNKELDFATELYKSIKGSTIIDATGKAIEEIASEILHELSFNEQ